MEEQKPVTHIVPSVGRVVWYWPGGDDVHTDMMWSPNSGQPLRADICYVHDCGTVNLSINDLAGKPFARLDVTLHQGDAEGCSLPRPFATWMPYQLEMALKQWISQDDDRRANERQERFTKPDSESDTAELQRRMLAEQLRELRLRNDAQEMTNQHLSKPLPGMPTMHKDA
jgi:hypothetical protein